MSNLPEIQLGQEIPFNVGKATVLFATKVPPANEGRLARYLLLIHREDEKLNPFVTCYLSDLGWKYREWDYGYYSDKPGPAIREYFNRLKQDVPQVS